MVLCLLLCPLGLSISAKAGGTKTIKFNVPGSGTAPNQGTLAFGINPSGTITGFDRDTNFARHAFLRAHDGTITVIDAPGAGTCPPICGGDVNSGPGTRAYSINPAGTITGFYTDNANHVVAYVRNANGAFTNFTAPDAGAVYPQGTFPQSQFAINPAGTVTGHYIDSNSVFHGFVRDPNGTLTEFDPSGSIFTLPFGINPAGAITGSYEDATIVFHGFVRAPDGTITSFDAPGADTTPGDGNGTFPGSLTPNGEIEGVYADAQGVNHGFVRDPNGTFRSIDVPGAGTGAGQGTIPESNNNPGAIAGNYIDASNVNHGFLLDKQGNVSFFDVPGTGTGAGQGTIPLNNNNPGTIIGQYIDGGNVTHGFIVEGL
jgi:hypothetical protein